MVCEERATKRESKRTAALRIAPKMHKGVVRRQSQTAGGSEALRTGEWTRSSRSGLDSGLFSRLAGRERVIAS